MINCHAADDYDKVISFLELPEPLTANMANSMHWSKQVLWKDAWRDMGVYNAKAIRPKGDHVFRLCVHQVLKRKAGRARDIDAITPSLKSYVDGLVLGGLAPDDSIAWYRGLCLHTPQMGVENRVRIDLYTKLT